MTDPERAKALEQLLLSEPAAARITGELVAKMLHGFSIPRLKDCDWFAERIRPLVWVIARQRMPLGDAEKRDELRALAARLRELWEDIRNLSGDIYREELELMGDLEARPNDSLARELLQASRGHDQMLLWRAKFFEELAFRFAEKRQPPKWRAKARREWRVRIALQLMPIFEEGFGRKATLNKWPSATEEKSLGPWAEFYQRVMSAALGENAVPDLEGVLTDARRELGSSGYSPGDFIGE